MPALVEVAELAAAFAPTRERHLETITLGRAFVDVTRAAWPCRALDQLQERWHGPLAYPVAVGVACAGHGIPLVPALACFPAPRSTANWISAGVRLIPLGQTDGQRLIARARAGGGANARSARSPPRSTISAARRSAPISPARGTRRNIPGCSAADGSERQMSSPNGPLRVGIGGPVGSGKTALMDALCKAMREHLRHRRHHQRHLHQVGRRVSGALRLARARPHRRRRDRRLPAYRDPRGRLDESRRGRRHAGEISATSIWS